MTEDTHENEVVTQAEEPESTEARPQGIIRGERGTDAAQVGICAFLLVVLGLLTYSGALRIPFHGEDQALFVERSALHRVVTAPAALDAFAESPLAAFGLALNYRLFGGAGWGLHLVSVLLHLANGVLVYLLARLLFKAPLREPMAMAAGMIFLLHPLASESVCYLAARPSLSSAFFGMLALLLYARGAGHRAAALMGALLCYVLAFASASLLLFLPLLGLALAYVRGGAGEIRRHWPVHALAIAVMLALGAVRAAAGLSAPETFPQGLGAVVAAQSALADTPGYHLLALRLFAPMHGLSVAFPDGGGMNLSLTGLLMLGLLAAGALFALSRRSALAVPLLWVLLTLLAAPCMLPLDKLMAERNSYFLLAGAVLALLWLLDTLRSAPSRQVAGVLAALLVAGGAWMTYQRLQLWREPVALWEMAAQGPFGAEAQIPKAKYLSWQADLAESDEELNARLTQAIQAWQAARDAAANPDDPEILAPLGSAYHRLGQDDAALPLLEEALRQDPGNEEAAVRIPLILATRAQMENDPELRRRALDYFTYVAARNPLPPEAQAAYAVALAGQGDIEQASVLMQSAAAGLPSDAPAAQMAGKFSKMAETIAKVDEQVQQVMTASPGSVEAQTAMAEAYLQRNRVLRAFYVLEDAVRAQPADVSAWMALGQTSAMMDSADSFTAQWGAAHAPDADAWRGLATRCGLVNRWDEALEYLSYAAGKAVGAPLPRVTLGGVAAALGQSARAAQLYADAAEAHPESPAPWLARCDLALAAGDADTAARALAEAEQRNASPEEVEARKQQGNLDTSRPQAPRRTVIR